jgi:hypothetical protein
MKCIEYKLKIGKVIKVIFIQRLSAYSISLLVQLSFYKTIYVDILACYTGAVEKRYVLCRSLSLSLYLITQC